MSAAPKNRRLYRRVDEHYYVRWPPSTDVYSVVPADRVPPLRELTPKEYSARLSLLAAPIRTDPRAPGTYIRL